MLPPQRRSVNPACCHGGDARSSPPSWRGWELATGALSIGVWALVPKCPLCLAAYMTLWTGIGLSFTQATYLRWMLLFSSAGFLCLLALRRILGWQRAR